MAIKFDSDGLAIVPGGTLTTAQVEQLIRDLCMARCQMAPEVPYEFGKDDVMLTQIDPSLSMVRVGNRFELCFRNAGFGWVQFGLGLLTAAAIRDHIASGLAGIDGAPLNRPGGDPTH